MDWKTLHNGLICPDRTGGKLSRWKMWLTRLETHQYRRNS
ncbi:putative terminase, ATPase subunit domain protein [Escherichia coli P0304777.8]|nr:putative terminase, ATPase subunit domain protein [Escherichia coli P0304777.8]